MSQSARAQWRVWLIGAPAFALFLVSSPAAAQPAAEPHDHSQHSPAQQRPAQQSPAQHDHSQHGASPQGHPGAAPADHRHHSPAAHDHTGHKAGHGTAKKSNTPAKHGGHPASHGASRRTAHRGHGVHKPAAAPHGGHGSTDHDGHGDHGMKGFLGPYPMMREGSGTSWLPDTTPHEGVMGKIGEWTTMTHGYFNLIYDHQGGPRGGDKTFVNGMVMGMAQRQFGDGTFGVRAMLSPDPFMGPRGYPLLLASGETADGKTPSDRSAASARSVHGAGGDSTATSVVQFERVRVCGPAGRACARPADLHAPPAVRQPGSTDHPPLARFDPHHLWRGDRRLCWTNWKIEASRFAAASRINIASTSRRPALDSYSARLS